MGLDDPEKWDREGSVGGCRMGNICKSMADSCQCTAKPLKYCKVISLQLMKIIGGKKSAQRTNIKKQQGETTNNTQGDSHKDNS